MQQPNDGGSLPNAGSCLAGERFGAKEYSIAPYHHRSSGLWPLPCQHILEKTHQPKTTRVATRSLVPHSQVYAVPRPDVPFCWCTLFALFLTYFQSKNQFQRRRRRPQMKALMWRR